MRKRTLKEMRKRRRRRRIRYGILFLLAAVLLIFAVTAASGIGKRTEAVSLQAVTQEEGREILQRPIIFRAMRSRQRRQKQKQRKKRRHHLLIQMRESTI